MVPPCFPAICVSQASAPEIILVDPKGELEFSPLKLKGTTLLTILRTMCQPESQMTALSPINLCPCSGMEENCT